MRYLRHFDSQEDYDAFIRSLTKDQTVLGSGPSGVHMHAVPSIDYSTPFYIENVDSVDATINIVGTNQDFEISSDKTTWVNYTKDTEVTIPSGNKLYIKTLQDTGTFRDDESFDFLGFAYASPLIIRNGKCAIGGNIMSLAYQNFENVKEITISEAFQLAFGEMRAIVDASKLVLPATELADGCYDGMFMNCTSLTTAPVLPATELVSNCYYQMFNGCSSLNYIKAMFTVEPSNMYTRNWVKGVASTGTFVKNVAATWDVRGTNGIPSGWDVETATA